MGEPNVQKLPEIVKDRNIAVHELTGREAELLSGALDIDSVFVGAGEIGDVVALHALVTSDGIADDGGIGGADVRTRVGIINGRGEVKLGLHDALPRARRAISGRSSPVLPRSERCAEVESSVGSRLISMRCAPRSEERRVGKEC